MWDLQEQVNFSIINEDDFINNTEGIARQLKIPVIGIIENMSGVVCPHCGKETPIFKKGGGEKAARNLVVPFLGRIPFETALVEMADKGLPFVQSGKDSPSSAAFQEIVRHIMLSLSDPESGNKG